MDIRFLESLIATVKTGSIAAAARKQGLTSAAVSQRIKTLENQLNIKLLLRDSHSARPTAPCKFLLPRMEHMVKQGKMLKLESDDSYLSVPFNIGCITSALTQYAPKIIKAFEHYAPKAELLIKPSDSSQLFRLLKAQKIDCAITTTPNFKLPKNIHAHLLINQQLVILSKFASSQPLHKQIQQNPFIAYDKTGWGGQYVYNWIVEQNLNPHILCELNSLETIAQLVDEGLGIAILPEWHGLYKHFNHLNITPVSKFGFKKARRQLSFLFHQQPESIKLLEIAKNSIIVKQLNN